MRFAIPGAAAILAALSSVQPAAADGPRARLQIDIPIDRILSDGVVYVSGSETYWVPDGYRRREVCDDRRHGRHRHVHVYYDPGHWSEDDWAEERWVKEHRSDDDSDSDSDSDKRKGKHKHRRHHRSYQEYGYREANGTLVLTIPIR